MLTIDNLINFYDMPAAIKALYDTPHGAAGGCLHIVLDDGNTEAVHVAMCVARAAREDCQECFTLGLSLLALDDTRMRDAALRNAGYGGSNAAAFEASRG